MADVVLLPDDQCRPEASCARTSRAILACIMRAKLVPAFDFFMVGQALHGVLGSMCKMAMGPLVAVYASLAARCEDGPEDTDMEVNYHKVAGPRLRRLLQMMESLVQQHSLFRCSLSCRSLAGC